MDYFVVFQQFRDNSLEAVVDPAHTREQIIRMIKVREYDNIVRIDQVYAGTVKDVTTELIDQAESELEEEATREWAYSRPSRHLSYSRHA
jgi:hypothetical protein